MNDKLTRKISFTGLFLAAALVLSYVEAIIPFYFGIPGMKLGLANLAIVILLYIYDWKTALSVNLLRVLISGFMFGNGFSIIYSMSGALLSFIIMIILKKTDRFSLVIVSAAGGIFHNIGQLVIATIIVSNYNLYLYAPVLVLAGTITGILIGIISALMIPSLKKVLY